MQISICFCFIVKNVIMSLSHGVPCYYTYMTMFHCSIRNQLGRLQFSSGPSLGSLLRGSRTLRFLGPTVVSLPCEWIGVDIQKTTRGNFKPKSLKHMVYIIMSFQLSLLRFPTQLLMFDILDQLGTCQYVIWIKTAKDTCYNGFNCGRKYTVYTVPPEKKSKSYRI